MRRGELVTKTEGKVYHNNFQFVSERLNKFANRGGIGMLSCQGAGNDVPGFACICVGRESRDYQLVVAWIVCGRLCRECRDNHTEVVVRNV